MKSSALIFLSLLSPPLAYPVTPPSQDTVTPPFHLCVSIGTDDANFRNPLPTLEGALKRQINSKNNKGLLEPLGLDFRFKETKAGACTKPDGEEPLAELLIQIGNNSSEVPNQGIVFSRSYSMQLTVRFSPQDALIIPAHAFDGVSYSHLTDEGSSETFAQDLLDSMEPALRSHRQEIYQGFLHSYQIHKLKPHCFDNDANASCIALPFLYERSSVLAFARVSLTLIWDQKHVPGETEFSLRVLHHKCSADGYLAGKELMHRDDLKLLDDAPNRVEISLDGLGDNIHPDSFCARLTNVQWEYMVKHEDRDQ
jgi:hypothetical protein